MIDEGGKVLILRVTRVLLVRELGYERNRRRGHGPGRLIYSLEL